MSEFVMADVMETTLFCVVILCSPVDFYCLADGAGAFVLLR